jgi:flagellar hook protein FlgE
MAVGSFSAGLSGLNANGTALSVIGNNLSNINTIGFKSSTVSFGDLVSQNVGGTSANPMQVGLGVGTGSISPVFSQGAIESTREATNVAIQGNGFFVVRNDAGNAYTRAGNFTMDLEGALVTPDGYRVQGYTGRNPVTGAIITDGTMTDLVVPPGVLRDPTATSQIRTVSNLDARAVTNDTYTTDVQIYDSLGATHVATITYTRRPANGTWDYDVTVPGAEIAGGVAGTPFSVSTGTLVFDAFGVLTTVNGAAPQDVTINTPTWNNGATTSQWTWDLVDANNQNPTLTGFASTSATSSKSQNGSAAARIESVSINASGEIIATFGAGQTISVGQLAVANFNNPKGLVKLGSNKYGESEAAGIANVGSAGTGGRGTLIGSAVEQSNVDIAQEFTQMILAQRGYQANSKTITVSDELLQETLNLKR